jgi:hypothetical protein
MLTDFDEKNTVIVGERYSFKIKLSVPGPCSEASDLALCSHAVFRSALTYLSVPFTLFVFRYLVQKTGIAEADLRLASSGSKDLPHPEGSSGSPSPDKRRPGRSASLISLRSWFCPVLPFGPSALSVPRFAVLPFRRRVFDAMVTQALHHRLEATDVPPAPQL